jgi:hypothetical protein
MGDLYRFSRASHAQSTTADSFTMDVPAGRVVFWHLFELTGMDSAAASGAGFGIFRVTSVGSGGSPTTITLKNVNPNGAAAPAGFTTKFGYTTPPTIEADPVWRGNYQPLGGKAKYMALPGQALQFWSGSAYQISGRGIAGTGNIAFDAEVELL